MKFQTTAEEAAQAPTPQCPFHGPPYVSEEEENQAAYCAGQPLSATERTKLVNALDRIRHEPDPICAQLAGIGDQVLAAADSQVRVFSQSDFKFGGAVGRIGAGGTGSDSWVVLNRRYFEVYETAYTKIHDNDGNDVLVNLQAAIAHELDHLYGNEHVFVAPNIQSKIVTPNFQRCGY